MPDIDNRGLSPHHEPVFRRSITQMVWANGQGHAEKTEDIVINGRITTIVMKLSACSNTNNITLTIDEGELGGEIFNSGAKAKGDTYIFDVAKDVCGTITIGVDPSADSGATSLTVDVTMYGV